VEIETMITTTERTTAIGVFNSQADAQFAIRSLRLAGFSDSDIGVTSRGGTDTPVANDEEAKVAIGAASGISTGASLGALWGIGIAAGLLPAIGPVIAGGTLAAIIASAASGATVAGVAGSLIALGIPEDEVRHYESEFEAGRTIVTVNVPPGRYDEANEILHQDNAVVHI